MKDGCANRLSQSEDLLGWKRNKMHWKQGEKGQNQIVLIPDPHFSSLSFFTSSPPYLCLDSHLSPNVPGLMYFHGVEALSPLCARCEQSDMRVHSSKAGCRHNSKCASRLNLQEIPDLARRGISLICCK